MENYFSGWFHKKLILNLLTQSYKTVLKPTNVLKHLKFWKFGIKFEMQKGFV